MSVRNMSPTLAKKTKTMKENEITLFLFICASLLIFLLIYMLDNL